MHSVTEAVLPNGLTVLIAPNHGAPVVTCWVGYRVGARNERPGITGASHWVEHMTFKGSNGPQGLAKGELFKLVSRHGGANNGFTSDDFTLYYETLPAEHLDVALRLEQERMAFSLFDPEETERERTVILAERDGAENSPHYRLSEQMGQAVYTRHPYRWPILGTRADLERLTREELLQHYRSYYTPRNATLVVVGAVDAEETLARIQARFGSIDPGPALPPEPDAEPEQTEERRVELREPGPAAYLSVAYRVPAAGHPDCYPLMMLDAVLSGAKSVSWGSGGYMGRSSRIYRALVEERLAVNAGSGFRAALDPGVFHLSLTLRPGLAAADAEAALLSTAEGVAANPPSPAELARVLRQSEAQFAYSRDGVTSQAYALMHFQQHGHWTDLHRHLDRLRAVTPEDVARVAATYLTPNGRTVGWFLPTS